MKLVLLFSYLGIFLILIINHSFASIKLPKFKQFICKIDMEKIKINQLMLDIADSEEKRSFGLMNRKKINPNSGMIFLWKDSKIRSFWMKNTYFNLDLFFLNSEGIIVEIYKNAKALDETYISSKNKVKYVIELKSGEHDFNVGDKFKCIENLS
tara:strand:+ start:32 stop:493 length:462 start_codon:yes stop_codon:yes gene_type:complete